MNYLLTDFNTDRWKGINLDSVESVINILIDKYKECNLYGEVGEVGEYYLSLSKASHIIENITYMDGMMYGDVKLLNTHYGKIAKSFYKHLNFNIRCFGESTPNAITIKRIVTWDIMEIDCIVEHRNDVIDDILNG